jgi:cytidine deaminase
MTSSKTVQRPEVVVGLVGAVGTDLETIADLVSEIVQRYGYDVEPTISLSGLLGDIQRKRPLAKSPREKYINSRMDAGNKLRRDVERGDALAQLAVAEIVRRRREIQARGEVEPERPPDAVAYVLRSLKHQAEVKTLRDIYRERFVCISAHAPRDERIRRLAVQIAESHGSTDWETFVDSAAHLAERDQVEEDDNFGQDVRGTFPLADFFVDATHRASARTELERFLDAWFGYPFASPLRDEYAMFHAHAAAARSSDLSRQVGAAIATDEGDIIAVGCNDVPRFGGGQYWPGDPDDSRDFMLGEDANEHVKATAIEEVRQALDKAGWLVGARRTEPVEAFARALKNTRIDRLTEFNRPMHAEMAAILDAVKRGVSTRGSSLFCTTFPCHNCAKHIVGAGIRRVVYIAPYPKSLAGGLHQDSVAIDPLDDRPNKVVFEPFVGVAPLAYLPLFQVSGKRKYEDGKALEFMPLRATPKLLTDWDVSYLEQEDVALVALGQALAEHNVKLVRGRRLPETTYR